MTLFPFFADIEGREGIIVGGGKHALDKVSKLLPFGPKLRLIAPQFRTELEQNKQLELIRRNFRAEDLDSCPAFVIAAGEDMEENRRISQLCRERKILINVVDDREYCDFVFPALIARGNLSIGICTDGASPATGVLLKKGIEAQVPDRIEEILDFLHSKRPVIRRSIADKKQRYGFYYKLSQYCLEKNQPLTEEEFQKLLVEENV
ncbi:MAG: bifunctional precorrin-2 dehydrogenase/sirohydrochlorin ferrochelatase [Lachnospiraceae bacterium]